MATYKVIQDIEAEDKLIGPLSFRQFVYALVAALCFYLSFVVLTKGATILLVVFLPPALVSAFFAYPFGQDQPTEVWALAKLRFMFKPRRRIWDQSGIKDLVTVTAPKKVEEVRTDGLSPHEVNSRLAALANTIDSRGWVVKNVNLNLSSQAPQLPITASSDRLIGVDGLPQEVPNTDVQAADDIMDEQNNPIAHQFDQMIAASTQAHHQQLTDMMNRLTAAPVAATVPQPAATSSGTPPADYWFLNQPVEPPKLGRDQAVFGSPTVVSAASDDGQPGVVQAAAPTAEEKAIIEQAKAEHSKPNPAYWHLKTIQPLGSDNTQLAAISNQPVSSAQTSPSATPATPTKPVTPQPKPAILELANNNDLNVATLARQANKANERLDDGEVVIALR